MGYQETYQGYLEAIEAHLSTLFLGNRPYGKLQEAMRYSLLSGGKRVRPVLTCAFAELNNYADALYFDEHRTVMVYTPEAVYTYRVFAAYVHNNEHLLACHDFADPAVFTQFFDELAQTPGLYGCVLEDELPEPGDLVLTLSTCFRTNRNQRFLVQAVLEETAYVEGEAE